MAYQRFYLFRKDNPRELALLVRPDVPAALQLRNATALLNNGGVHAVLDGIYTRIAEQGIVYNPDQPTMPGRNVQLIRTSVEILTTQQANCLDMTVLFASCCLAHHLLPLIVLLHPTGTADTLPAHSYVAVATSSIARYPAPFAPETHNFKEGLLTDEGEFQLLTDSFYLALETTGAIVGTSLSPAHPEGERRGSDGRMSFDDALLAGLAHLDGVQGRRSFQCSLDITALHSGNYQPDLTPLPSDPLKDAQLLLEAMPVAHDMPLPQPQTRIPAPSRIPLAANPRFVGREGELRTVARSLQGTTWPYAGNAPTVIVCGFPGIGKTSVATAFAYQYGPYFAGGVFWINCSEEANIDAELASCGSIMNLPGFDNLPTVEEKAQRVLEAWQDPIPRLLILDNCEDPRRVATLRPSIGGARVLVTSRRTDWDEGESAVAVVPVPELPLEMSRRMLLEPRAQYLRVAPEALINDRTEAEATDGICALVGNLPLALALAAAFLRASPRTRLSDYLQRLQQAAVLAERSLQEVPKDWPLAKYRRGVAAAIALSYDQLSFTSDVDVRALLLLRAASFCATAPIPERLIIRAALSPRKTLDQEADYDEAFQRLTDLGLLQRQIQAVDTPTGTQVEGSALVHRLIALYVRRNLLPTTELPHPWDLVIRDDRAALEHALIQELKALIKAGRPRERAAYVAHVYHFAGRPPTAAASSPRLMLVPIDTLAEVRSYLGGGNALRPFYGSRLLKQSVRQQPPEDGTSRPQVAPHYARLVDLAADFFIMIGDLTASKHFAQRSIELLKRVPNRRNSEAARLYYRLGDILMSQAAYDEARAALTSAEVLCGSALPDNETGLLWASVLDRIGQLNCAVGAFEEAYKVFCKARDLKLALEMFPDNIRAFYATLLGLSEVFMALGDVLRAHAYAAYVHTSSRREQEQILDHAICASKLASIDESVGHFGAARSNFEEAYRYLERELGAHHPQTIVARTRLASFLWRGFTLDTIHLFMEQQLAEQYSTVVRIYVPLIDLGIHFELTDIIQAHTNLIEALGDAEQVFGSQHPETAYIRAELGQFLAFRYQAGEELRAVAAQAATEGSEINAAHPSFQPATDDLDTARKYLTSAVSTHHKLGDHPLYTRSLLGLGIVYSAIATVLQSQGDPEGAAKQLTEARQAMERAIEVGERAYGRPHIEIARMLTELHHVYRVQRDLTSAYQKLKGALDVYDATVGIKHPSRLRTLDMLATLAAQMERWGDANNYLKELYNSLLKTDKPMVHQAILGSWREQAIADLEKRRDPFELFYHMSSGKHRPGIVLGSSEKLRDLLESFATAFDISSEMENDQIPDTDSMEDRGALILQQLTNAYCPSIVSCLVRRSTILSLIDDEQEHINVLQRIYWLREHSKDKEMFDEGLKIYRYSLYHNMANMFTKPIIDPNPARSRIWKTLDWMWFCKQYLGIAPRG